MVTGALKVPLKENHAATRDRWSLKVLTDSNKERVKAQLPGFECMFKHAGKIKQGKLQEFLKEKKTPMKVTVVTSPSGSYREFDIIEFMEKHLKPWGPDRIWEIFMLDAYGPGLTRNVQTKSWSPSPTAAVLHKYCKPTTQTCTNQSARTTPSWKV